jgi:rubrerythrin
VTSERALAASVWRARRAFELDAAVRFARLSDELTALQAGAEVVALARQAADDERRHAQLCADLVTYFGGQVTDAAAPAAAPVSPSGLVPRERLLYEVVALACVTETLSTALLGTLVERATDDVVRRTMHEILRDEVQHSRLGWAHLAGEHAHGARDVVGAHLPAMLRATVREELFTEEGEHPQQEALSGLGALSRRDRIDVCVATMTSVVFPGLERFGVDTSRGRRWLAELI